MKKMLFVSIIHMALGTLGTPGILIAQNHVLDSLKQALKTQQDDTNKVNTLIALSDELRGTVTYDSLLAIANKALTLATKLRFENGKGYAYRNIGIWYSNQGNYPVGLKYYQQGLAVFQKTGNKNGIQTCFNHIGGSFYNQANYPKALEYWLKTLDLSRETGDNKGIAAALNNVGCIYSSQQNYGKALEYYFTAMDMNRKIGNKFYEVRNLTSIGDIYLDQGKYDSASKYLFTSLNISKEIGDKSMEAGNLSAIGNMYAYRKNYNQALEYEFNALTLSKEVGETRSYGSALNNIGQIYTKQKKYTLSGLYFDSALFLSKQIGDRETIKNTYMGKVALDSATDNYKAELLDNKLYDLYRDSLSDEKTLKEEMNYEADRKADSLQAEHDKEDIIKEKETQQLKVIRNFLMGGGSIAFIAAGVFFFQRRRIAAEKKRSDELLLNILPAETAEELKQSGEAKAKSFDLVTVIFTDFVGFTRISEKLSSTELVNELNYLFRAFDNIIQKHNLEKIKTIGDSYMAAGGLPIANLTHAKDAVNTAIEIIDFMQQHNIKRATENKPVFEIRIGINTGPVVAGIVGIKKFSYDIWGDTVNIASRMESSGEPGKINISGSTYQLVKNDFTCIYRGKVKAKNKGEVDMYFVEL